MDKNLCLLVGLLPENAILEAARDHIRELGLAGDLEAAKDLCAVLLKSDERGLSAAKATRFLVGRLVFRGNNEEALELYFNFPEGDRAVFQEKLMTCDLLVRTLSESRTLEAWELWRPLGENLQSAGLKWHWAQTGLALLETCYKKDLFRLGKEIVTSLMEFSSCEETLICLEKAKSIREKLERRSY